ncbi:hypothetical protein JCM1840_004378 [Sporobolomyces johnsonii]
MPPPRIGGYSLSLPTSLSLSKLLLALVACTAQQLLPRAEAAPLNSAGSDGADGAKGWMGRALGELVKRQAEEGGAYSGEKLDKQDLTAETLTKDTPGSEFRTGDADGPVPFIARSAEFVLKLVFSVVFVLLGGIFSGLSLGLMGLDATNLQVLAASGPPQDRQDARKVLSLLSHGRHFVLVCLLLSNVIVNETLPVFLDSITGGSGFIAVAVSSALIVIFGEVLPQALCAQYGLRIGAKCVGFVKVLMFLESPICYPTARLLDWLLGVQHVHLYRREELKTLIELHSSPASFEQRGGLSEMEVDVVRAALGLGERTVEECMKRKDEVYGVNDGMRVCDVDLKEVMIRSQSYIPVKRARLAQYSSQSKGEEEVYVGLVTATQLVAALSRPDETIRSLPLLPLVQVTPDTTIYECLTYLRNQDPSAVFLISKSASQGAGVLGFATQDDLALSLLTASSRDSDSASPVTVVAPPRPSSARARGASGSLGMAAFVRGIVNRQRAHRASASSLSFQLSDGDDDSAASYHSLAVSHSHHHSSSPSLRSPTMRHASLGTGSPAGLGGSFRFPSPVFEETETFALGDEGEGEGDDDSLLRQGRGDSGFGEERGIGDPLGAGRGGVS